jgi:F-BAR and double SH3 domains protein
MSVQEIPRSSSEASLRTDGENPSSDSFYDSDNAEVEARSQFKQVASTAATVSKSVEDKRDTYRESFHESSEFEDDDEDDRPPPQQQAPVQQESFAAWDGKSKLFKH